MSGLPGRSSRWRRNLNPSEWAALRTWISAAVFLLRTRDITTTYVWERECPPLLQVLRKEDRGTMIIQICMLLRHELFSVCSSAGIHTEPVQVE